MPVDVVFESLTRYSKPDQLSSDHLAIVPNFFPEHFLNDYKNESLNFKEHSATLQHIQKTIENYFNVQSKKPSLVTAELPIRASVSMDALVLVHLGAVATLQQKRNGTCFEHIIAPGSVIFIANSVAHRFAHTFRATSDESMTWLFECRCPIR